MSKPDTTTAQARPPTGRRVAAVVALLTLVVAMALALIGIATHVWFVLGSVVAIATLALAGWYAVSRTGVTRVVAIALVILSLAAFVAFVIAANLNGWRFIAGLVAAATSIWAARRALGPATAAPTSPVVPPVGAQRPVLLMNPKSGGGKVERFHLVEEARRRGIEPVVLRPGDDLRALVLEALGRGADALGAAGGDGSQAIVATIAIEHGLPFVCVPAGTRNHLALDLGVDRDDVVAALDAFADGPERVVDVGLVGDRVFVNNVSFGVYGEVVQADSYRDAKLKTAAAEMPELLGPGGRAPELRFSGPDGAPRATRDLVLVS